MYRCMCIYIYIYIYIHTRATSRNVPEAETWQGLGIPLLSLPGLVVAHGIYIYIYREREMHTHIYIYICLYLWILDNHPHTQYYIMCLTRGCLVVFVISHMSAILQAVYNWRWFDSRGVVFSLQAHGILDRVQRLAAKDLPRLAGAFCGRVAKADVHSLADEFS